MRFDNNYPEVNTSKFGYCHFLYHFGQSWIFFIYFNGQFKLNISIKIRPLFPQSLVNFHMKLVTRLPFFFANFRSSNVFYASSKKNLPLRTYLLIIQKKNEEKSSQSLRKVEKFSFYSTRKVEILKTESNKNTELQ